MLRLGNTLNIFAIKLLLGQVVIIFISEMFQLDNQNIGQRKLLTSVKKCKTAMGVMMTKIKVNIGEIEYALARDDRPNIVLTVYEAKSLCKAVREAKSVVIHFKESDKCGINCDRNDNWHTSDCLVNQELEKSLEAFDWGDE